MRIAYIVGTFPVLTTTFISQEIMVLGQLGHEIEVISIRRPRPESRAELVSPEPRVRYLLPASWWAVLTAHLFWVVRHPADYFRLLVFLLSRSHPTGASRLMTLLHFGEGVYAARLLQSAVPGHVHAHFLDRASLVALCVSRLLGIPYSVTAHANDIFVRPVLVREKIQESRFIITVSRFNRDYLIRQYPDTPEDKILVLHPWVNVSEVRPRPEAECAPGSPLQILSVGRLVEKKGHRYLIEACRGLRERGVSFHCRIVGDGPLYDDLKTRISTLGLGQEVELLGARTHREVLEYLSVCDVFVLACVVAESGDRDGMPVALAEAMATEVPVIATDILGIGEMVRPGTGALVAEKDASALAEALEELARAGPAARKAMGERGRACITQEFDLVTGVRNLALHFARSSANGELATSRARSDASAKPRLNAAE